MNRETIIFGRHGIALWCNHSHTEPCERSPTAWSCFIGMYYGRCDLHKSDLQQYKIFNSLDDIKADIAMWEL